MMIGSLAESTIKQYNSPLRYWWEFCLEKNINPFEANITEIASCLTKKFQEDGAAYGTLNSMRSAISLISKRPLSEDIDLNRLLRGTFKKRPSFPKYESTWDANIVLKEAEKWHPLDSLDLQKLTEKLVVLLALGSGFRAQSLALIKLSGIVHKEDGIEIRINDLIKTSRPGIKQPRAKLKFFRNKPELCIADTLIHYIDRTKDLRNGADQLLLSYKFPHKTITSQTVSRWLKKSLKDVGVSEDFSAHSFRHASTSKAYSNGLSESSIKDAVGWSLQSDTFDKFYNRPIESQENFASRVFAEVI